MYALSAVYSQFSVTYRLRVELDFDKREPRSLLCIQQDTRAVARLQGQRTATYCAVITENGELSLGLGDMDIHKEIKEQYVSATEHVDSGCKTDLSLTSVVQNIENSYT